MLEGLNDEQRTAVETVDGPLMIVAGPGTGKTRVLAHRIAYLLARIPDLTPERFLAVTFSRRAAEEMRERVESLLGAHADELQVSTFHAFCYQLLQHHGVEIGLPRRLLLLGHVDQWLMVRTVIRDMTLEYYDRRVDPTGCVEGMLRCLNRAKDEVVLPEEYARYAAGLQDPEERRRQADVARVYERYQQALRAAGAMDFGDLIVETIRLFRERPAVLATYQQTLPYLLVDEFQDANVAQIQLVSMIAASHRNLCVVGDDDQAIYRFRGASYASFVLFQEQFPEAKQVRLTQSYRSTPRILRAAGRLIQANGDNRYDPEKRVWTSRATGDPVEVLVCQDYDHEARVIAERIRALLAAMPDDARAYRRIAVLYRAHAHRDRIVQALEREGIPHVVTGGSALFDEEVIKDLMAWLRVIHDPSDSVSVFRILSHPTSGLRVSELAAIGRAARDQRRTLYEVMRARRAVSLRAPAWSRVKAFLGLLHELQRMASRGAVDGLIRRLLDEVGYRPRLLAAMDAGARRAVIALSQWYQLVRAHLEARPASPTVEQVLEYLAAYQEVGGEIREESPTQRVDGVQLMTVHQAKGLEFDWVIVPSLVQGRFPAKNRPELVPFPVELMKERLPSGDVHVQEERRLCYVAVTRAREALTLTTVERPYHRPSRFVRDLLDDPELRDDVRRRDPAPPTVLAQVQPALSQADLAALEREQVVLEVFRALRRLRPGQADAIEAQIARLTEAARGLVMAPPEPLPTVPPPTKLLLSFTQLETYQHCPLKYQYKYVYHIPTRPTPKMQLGSNLHSCLEELARRLMAGQAPTLDDVLALFEETWRPDGYSDPRIEAKDKALGRQMIIQYYEANRDRWRPPLFVEKPFRVQVGGAWLQGFIDRIDALPDGRVEVLDYKSGKPKTSAEVEDHLQLSIYALACRDVLNLTPATLSFYYLQNNERLSFPYEEASVAEAERTIHETAQKIRQEAFDPLPEYGKCRMCDYRTICPASAA